MCSSEAAAKAYSAFVGKRFTKADLALLCEEKGGRAPGSKEALIDECLQLYTAAELMKRLNLAQSLPWYRKLIIASLLQGGKSIREIVGAELARTVLAGGLPAAAFGEITDRVLSIAESKERLARRVYQLRKTGIILADKEKGIYHLNPFMTDYFAEGLGLISAEELSKNIADFVAEVISTGERYGLLRSVSTPEERSTRWANTKKDWTANLNQFFNLFKEAQKRFKAGPGELRFGVPFVTVGNLSKQYYCEQKVQMAWVLGEAETESMRAGSEAHESLLKDTVEVKLEEAWQDVFSGKPTLLREMLLLAERKGVIVIGRADAVIFERSLPIFLFEYKFTGRRFPFRDMHVQARTYCYLLHEMGFNTQALKYALVLGDPKLSGDKEFRRKLAWFVIRKATEHPEDSVAKVGNARVYVNKFNLAESESELDWALEFWTRQRDAKPTTKAAKCKVCEFCNSCPYAL